MITACKFNRTCGIKFNLARPTGETMSHTPRREILIFVAGSTPQIITETIQGLSRQSSPVYATEIHIITTLLGHQRIYNSLIKDKVLQHMCIDLSIPPIPDNQVYFHIPLSDQGSQLDDIRSERENEIIGDLITSLVRQLAGRADTRLHCSIAGGRKTMSFYLGAALQLFGRPQDRLYHALVSPEFESNPRFFFIPTVPVDISGRAPDGTAVTLNTANAAITLAELPFIRLGGSVGFKGASFVEMVAEGQRSIDTATLQPEVLLDLSERTITIARTQLELIPTQLMLYTAILRQKTEYCKYPERPYCGDCTACYLVMGDLATRPALERMACDYAAIYGNRDKAMELLEKWPDGLDLDALRQHISKLNRSLRDQIADQLLSDYIIIECKRSYGSSRYGVRVDKGKITINCQKEPAR